MLVLASALTLPGCGMTEQTLQRGYVVPEGALEQIPLGSSQEQVLIVLGTPSTVATVTGEVFYYISQRGEKAAAFMPQKVVDQRVIAVYFDKERRVSRLADYGVKVGRTAVDVDPVLGLVVQIDEIAVDRKSTRLNSSHRALSRMPSSA